jgi:hypothetical protein
LKDLLSIIILSLGFLFKRKLHPFSQKSKDTPADGVSFENRERMSPVLPRSKTGYKEQNNPQTTCKKNPSLRALLSALPSIKGYYIFTNEWSIRLLIDHSL